MPLPPPSSATATDCEDAETGLYQYSVTPAPALAVNSSYTSCVSSESGAVRVSVSSVPPV